MHVYMPPPTSLSTHVWRFLLHNHMAMTSPKVMLRSLRTIFQAKKLMERDPGGPAGVVKQIPRNTQ
jgi:hypothetical protein